MCGDGDVNESAGEVCDEGFADTATCLYDTGLNPNLSCHPSSCGDGSTNEAAGEGNYQSGMTTLQLSLSPGLGLVSVSIIASSES